MQRLGVGPLQAGVGERCLGGQQGTLLVEEEDHLEGEGEGQLEVEGEVARLAVEAELALRRARARGLAEVASRRLRDVSPDSRLRDRHRHFHVSCVASSRA